MATDGLLAAFVQCGQPQNGQPEGLERHSIEGLEKGRREAVVKPNLSFLLGHLRNFEGPVAKEHVFDVDWDWERNTRRVNVFKRKNGTFVILPCDSEARSYWEEHTKCSDVEHALFQSLAVDQISRVECEEALARLGERSEKKTKKPKKTSLEKALELLKKLT